MITVRYYANGARFRPGNMVTISDRLYMRMLWARDDYDVWSILVTGRPLPPCGGMAVRKGEAAHRLQELQLKYGPELLRQYREKWPELQLFIHDSKYRET